MGELLRKMTCKVIRRAAAIKSLGLFLGPVKHRRGGTHQLRGVITYYFLCQRHGALFNSKIKMTDSLSRDAVAVADTLAAMITREEQQISSSTWHEDGYINPSDPTMTTADDRKKLVNWCYHFVDHCQLSRETVASAMEMVDRFLSTASKSSIGDSSADADLVRSVSYEAARVQRKLQLLTITGLYVAIKINERVALSSDLFAEMCCQAYSTEEIEDMERVLLSGLSWRCHAPTALQVGLSILSIILPTVVNIPEETWGVLMDEMKYLIELTVLDYYFSTQRTSTVALAAIYNATSSITCKVHQELLRTSLSVITERFDFDHPKKISEVRRKLLSLILDDDVDEECSLDEGHSGVDNSVRTCRIANRSFPEEEVIEDRFISSYERDEIIDLESGMSPNSSLHDLSLDL